MNTHQATYETAIERLERHMAERDAKRDAEAARRDAKRDAEAARRDVEAAKRDTKRDAEAAKRDKDNSRWQVTLFIATIGVVGIATAILGVLMRLPPAAAV